MSNMIFKIKIDLLIIGLMLCQVYLNIYQLTCKTKNKTENYYFGSNNNGLFQISDNLNDTTFLLKNSKSNYYHSVYIDNNRNSLNYRKLLNFNCIDEGNDNLKIEKNDVKKYSKNQLLNSLPKEWMPLYKYKKKYYLYAPSDWGNVNKKLLTDTGIINWDMEGCSFDSLKLVKKISSNSFLLKIKSSFNESSYKIIIHIIDEIRKIAIWEYIDNYNHSNFALYVAKEKANTFNLIVNYCNTMKQPEFEFEKINFNKLLKKR